MDYIVSASHQLGEMIFQVCENSLAPVLGGSARDYHTRQLTSITHSSFHR